METKECTKCHEVKPVEKFEAKRKKCRACRNLENKEWRERNREYDLQRLRDYHKTPSAIKLRKQREQRPDVKAYNRKRHRDYMKTEKGKILQRRIARKYRMELGDGYCKAIFRYRYSDINFSDIPQKFIELQRAKIMLHRTIYETKLKGEQHNG